MFVVPLTRTTQGVPQFSRFIDRLFDESIERALPAAATRTPALDVSETDAGYTVAFEVPGVSREQLKVSIDGRRVSVETAIDTTSEKTEGDAPKDNSPRVLYRERSVARYARTVSLPAEVDQASSSAKFENGVLTLTLAKKVPTGATQLAIN